MEILDTILRISLFLHLIAFASIFSGVFSQVRNFKIGAPITGAILHGAWLALITGLILTGLVYVTENNVNHLALALKGCGILGIFLIAYTVGRKPIPPKWAVPTIGVLTVLNVLFAVMVKG